MALQVPMDIPRDSFTRAGLMALDGDIFEGGRKVSPCALLREIEYVKDHVTNGNLKTQNEWQQVRNVVLLWCFSHRSTSDNNAINDLLHYVGLTRLRVPDNSPTQVFVAIEARHDQPPIRPSSPADWIKQRPPPQRLPTPASLSPLPHDHQQSQLQQGSVSTNNPFHSVTTFQTPTTPTTPVQAPTSLNLNANPKFQGRYTFTEHRQEYEGYQFQCIFRCLKDGKHCRKAPVREMNRHLRDRHHFRPGFKIAGVDWERKRWRGAGADHEECVGKLVEKDSGDDVADDAGESGDESEAYVVR